MPFFFFLITRKYFSWTIESKRRSKDVLEKLKSASISATNCRANRFVRLTMANYGNLGPRANVFRDVKNFSTFTGQKSSEIFFLRFTFRCINSTLPFLFVLFSLSLFYASAILFRYHTHLSANVSGTNGNLNINRERTWINFFNRRNRGKDCVNLYSSSLSCLNFTICTCKL